MLDHDLAIGCKSLLPDDLRAILKNNGIQLIAMPEDKFFKSKTLGVIILALSPRNLVTMNFVLEQKEALLVSQEQFGETKRIIYS